MTKKRLAGQVAVVAGATRGAGRGIARALAEAGAVVYCAGRSVRGNPSLYNRPKTIDETADIINAAGEGHSHAMVRLVFLLASQVKQPARRRRHSFPNVGNNPTL